MWALFRDDDWPALLGFFQIWPGGSTGIVWRYRKLVATSPTEFNLTLSKKFIAQASFHGDHCSNSSEKNGNDKNVPQSGWSVETHSAVKRTLAGESRIPRTSVWLLVHFLADERFHLSAKVLQHDARLALCTL